MPYSYDAMTREIDDLGRDARHLAIVPDKLREVADAMRRELAAPGASFQTDPLQYPHESPTENTRETLQ
ncbi:MAG TPA: hypothetical protein VFM39_02980, partial [bacterium]|nr:hypothetical protein [bacterium]